MLINIIYAVIGLLVFVKGLTMLSSSLRTISGPKIEEIIKLLTSNKWMGAGLGFFITLLLQSSTATTVTVVSFVEAGLLTLAQSVGVIMGANIGTTVSSLVFTLDFNNINTFLVLIGILMIIFANKNVGKTILGFGFIFLGIQVMTNGMSSIANLPVITNLFDYTNNPLFGLMFGLVLTAILQSSSAVTGLLLAMVGSGILSGLDQVIFVIYGQAIGTCFTAIIAGFRGTKNAKRAAMIHLMFNIIGTLVFTVLTLLPLGYIDFIKGLTLDLKMQILYAQIIYNIVMVLLLLPMSDRLIKIVKKIIK